MALSRLTAGAAFSNTVSYSGTYAAGDIIVVCVINAGGSTTPTLPSGYTLIASASDSTNGFAMSTFFKVATSASESSITVTNATEGSYAIYRGQASTPFTNISGQSGSGTSISYSGIVTMSQSGGASTSWVLYFAVANNSTAQVYNAAPTNTSEVVAASNFASGPPPYAIEIFDTNTTISSVSFNSKTLAVTTPWLTKTAELNAAVPATLAPKPRTQLQAVNRAARF